MAFFECEFPTAIAYGATGGQSFSTTINTGFSGYEQRNRNWALALGKWEIVLFNKPQSYFDEVYSFWLNVGGRADAFRFKDHKDCTAIAQYIGTGDGSTTEFQLQKTYTVAGRSYIKPIKKPITSAVQKFDGTFCSDTVNIYVGGTRLTLGSDFTVDHTSGSVTLATAPADGAIITSDFQFHHPVRFDTDDCKAVVEESDVAGGEAHITWSAVQLVEVRLSDPVAPVLMA